MKRQMILKFKNEWLVIGTKNEKSERQFFILPST